MDKSKYIDKDKDKNKEKLWEKDLLWHGKGPEKKHDRDKLVKRFCRKTILSRNEYNVTCKI